MPQLSGKLKETNIVRNLGRRAKNRKSEERVANDFFRTLRLSCNNIKLQQKGTEDPFPGNHKIKVNPHQSSKKLTY